jgi:GNAT superfamily N-acetyltransferase
MAGRPRAAGQLDYAAAKKFARTQPQDYLEPMLTIRAATLEDAEKIAHVHVESWRSTYPGIVPEEYLAALSVSGRAIAWREGMTNGIAVHIAELNGEVVGFISGGPIREPIAPYDGELYAVYILQQAQGQGIGKALLQELARLLLGQGFASMAVWVLEQNPAKHFYMHTGAELLASKEIEIGGAVLADAAYGWPDLRSLARKS